MRPYHGGARPSRPGPTPQSARERLAARIAAIQDRAGTQEPAPEREPVEDAPPPRSVTEAEQNLASVLPVASVERWSRLADGRWVEHSTGLVEDAPPPGHDG